MKELQRLEEVCRCKLLINGVFELISLGLGGMMQVEHAVALKRLAQILYN